MQEDKITNYGPNKGLGISMAWWDPVSKDEELTIPYVDTRLGRSERRERLRKNFAFDCACERCAAEA